MSAEASKSKTDNNEKSTSKEEDSVMVPSAKKSSSMKSDDKGSRTMVKFVSSDGRTFELPLEAAKSSGMVRDALNLEDENSEKEDDDDDDDDDDNNKPQANASTVETIDLNHVRGDALEKIVEFLKHNHEADPMQTIPMQINGTSLKECVPQEWYQKFAASMKHEILLQVISAANYMNIGPLFDLMTLCATFELNGKDREEIREYLGVPHLTAADETQAREEHPWLFEEGNDTTSSE